MPVKLITLSNEAFFHAGKQKSWPLPCTWDEDYIFPPSLNSSKANLFLISFMGKGGGTCSFFLNCFSYIQSSLVPYKKHIQPLQGQTRLFKNRLRHLLGPILQCLNTVSFSFQMALSFISVSFLIQCLFYSSTIIVLNCEIQVCYLGSSVTRKWETEFPPWITDATLEGFTENLL